MFGSHDEARLLDALRRGDAEAFETIVHRHASAMLRVALTYVRSRAVAEEVVQDTWIAVLGAVDRFERRSSLKTWIFRILTNTAKTRAAREGRTVPFSDLPRAASQDESAVEPERFLDQGSRAGSWAHALHRWADDSPAERLYARETRERVSRAIRALPPAQRIVLALRDVEGWSAAEVCDALELSDENQRVLLHRARSRVRRALERYFEGSQGSS
ncbi:MAG: sigma-70 family RNA polymerase sigma factor [Actinobacteria bacterium]|nr:sigma-70 family RNA polymerase sigma factor [Actinomycetota bacterium]